jgi:pimeloyl-ACP methyl ester carboxylesterase
VLPALASAGFRAVAPFMRGYTPTTVPADGRYDVETLGRDVVTLIEALAPDGAHPGRAIVVGHDWGAAAAYAAVGLAPSRIAMLATVAIPHPAGVLPTPSMLWAVRHFASLRFPNAAAKVRKNDFAYVDELIRRWSPAWDVPPDAADHVKRVFADPASLDAALGYYRAITLPLPASYRRKVVVPTVAFAGENDIVPPHVYERARRRFEAEYEVVRMPGGHFMHREDPARFVAELVPRVVAARPRFTAA